MHQFQVYADYGANYELVARDIEEEASAFALLSSLRASSRFDFAVPCESFADLNFMKACSDEVAALMHEPQSFVFACFALAASRASPLTPCLAASVAVLAAWRAPLFIM